MGIFLNYSQSGLIRIREAKDILNNHLSVDMCYKLGFINVDMEHESRHGFVYKMMVRYKDWERRPTWGGSMYLKLRCIEKE